jgi:uncharacterized protein YjbI with pentapeptide repeats
VISVEQIYPTKPEGWDGKDLSGVKGAQLSNRSLRYVLAQGAFGVKADSERSDLRGANFASADLRFASFEDADLTGAFLFDADLRGAKFFGAKVGYAHFVRANVDGAHFFNAIALEPHEIEMAANWILATLDTDALVVLGLCAEREPCDYEARRFGKDFSGMDLSKGNFQSPDLSGANLRHSKMSTGDLSDSNLSKADLRDVNWGNVSLNGANLAGADLRGTDLRNVDGLTLTQIESAITDDKTKLPPYLEAQKPFPPKK